jgi:hypothetical protein
MQHHTTETKPDVLAQFLALQLRHAFQERGQAGITAKLGEWGNTLTPSDIQLLLRLAGLPALNS